MDLYIVAPICSNSQSTTETPFWIDRRRQSVAVTRLLAKGIHCGVSNEADTNDVVLNLRGLRCPQPVLRAKKALRNVPVGGTLVLECTDPLTVIDVPHFANQTGHSLVSQERRQESELDLYVFKIVKRH